MPVIDSPVETPTRRIVPPTTLPSIDIPGFDGWESVLPRDPNLGGPYIVILYDDDWHTFDDVIEILMKATGCTADEGEAIAWEVHTKGRAICFSGTEEECERVAAIIRTIRLQVETDRA